MRVVAVLGGGGAKSLAHAGAWRALLEAGVRPSHIVGTSMGAVVGAAFAAGSTYDRFVEMARSLGPKDVAALDRFALVKGVFAANIFKPEPLQKSIARLVPATRFAQLEIPLTVTATDVDSGELILFGAPTAEDASGRAGKDASGRVGAQHAAPLHHPWVYLGESVSLVEALYASCALPLYFPPGRIDGRRLADGGLRAALPLGPASKIPADLVVAIDVGPGFDEPPTSRRAPIPALVRAHGEAIRVMMAAQTERAIAEWPKQGPRLVVVRAVAEREATFAVGEGERYLKAGYDATRRALGDRLGG